MSGNAVIRDCMHVCVPSDRRCSLMKDIVRLIDAVHKLNTVRLLAEWKITYDTLVKLSVQNRRTRDRRKAYCVADTMLVFEDTGVASSIAKGAGRRAPSGLPSAAARRTVVTRSDSSSSAI